MKKSGISESGELLKPSKEYPRESDELYRSLYESSMDAILLTGTDGSIFSANPAACKMFGWSEEEICRLGRNDLVDISDPRLEAGLRLRKRKGSVFGELTMIRKNGEKFPVEISSNIFKDPAGKQRTSMIIREISDRKKVEMTLQLQSEILKNITEGIILVRLSDETIVFTNPGFDRMFGYEPGELIGKDISLINAVTDKSPAEIKQEIINILNLAGEWHGEILNKKKNDEQFWCSAHVTLIDHILYGKVSLSVHSDISARKKLEQEMQYVSVYTRNLIEASIDSLVTVGVDRKITDVNFATEKITGIERKKLIGSDFTEYFTEPDKAERCFNTVIKNGVIKDYSLTIVHKSGRQTDVLYNATLFTNETGEIQGIFAAARDITIRKKIEEELRKSKELLEKLNRRQNEIKENERALISREIHDELGQSMTALKLDLFMMRKYVSDNTEALIKLENMTSLISDTIRIVQRISSDLRPGILDDLGLVAAIEWYCDEFENRTGIKCCLKLKDCDITDSSISLMFYRVLQESLTNVIRHSGASAVTVELHNSLKGTTLTIHDNGIGIASEKINSYNSMGLINIRERVRQFNGKATILSKHGEGTKITVFIPL
jgi:PAS domain S-box-containing protein